MPFVLADRLADRMVAAIRWVEQQSGGGPRGRGRLPDTDPFERCKLTAELAKGGSAPALLYEGSASIGWTITTREITVYEDNWLETGEKIPSGRDIEVKWMHGDWTLNDAQCSDVSTAP